MGVITLDFYDHHAGRIAERLTELQHGHLEQVVTTTHVHLDQRLCLEVILLRGTAGHVRELADKLIGTKGVETGRLVLDSRLAGLRPAPASGRTWAFAPSSRTRWSMPMAGSKKTLITIRHRAMISEAPR